MPSINPQSILMSTRALLDAVVSSPPPGRELYLDPGSGSYLLQLLLAGLVGSLFVVRTFWSRIKAFFRRDSGEEEIEAANTDDEE